MRPGAQTNGNALSNNQEQSPSNVNGEQQLTSIKVEPDSDGNKVAEIKTEEKNSTNDKNHNNKSSIKCLETLAQKAGIVFDETYEVANTLLTLDKQQTVPTSVAQTQNNQGNQNGENNSNNIVQQNLIVVDQNNQLHEFHNQAMAQIKQLVEASGL